MVFLTLKKSIFQIREVNLYKLNDVTYYNFKQTLCPVRACFDEVIEKSDYDTRRKQVEEFNIHNK